MVKERHKVVPASYLVLIKNGKILLQRRFNTGYEDGKYKSYFKGTSSHNTVVVDGKDQGKTGTVITGELVQEDGYTYQTAQHNLYLGVLHKRSVIMIGDNVIILVDDMISTGGSIIKAAEFLKKQKYIIFTIFSVITAGIHKPTFLLLALSFLAFTILNYKNNLKKNIISGIAIIILTLLIYIGRIKTVILPGITEAAGLAIGPGTFITLTAYKALILIYIPFLTIGLYHLIHNKKYNILFIWFIINFIIVVFRLFFFNRYIIHLDLIILIIISIGLLEILKDSRKIGVITILIIFGFLSYNVIGESLTIKPSITQQELSEIKELQETEENAYVMATHSYYSPWVLGYSGRKTIAPGLFEYNKWDVKQWQEFWKSDNVTEMLKDYERPLYIHVGKTGNINTTKFNNDCYESFNEKIWNVKC